MALLSSVFRQLSEHFAHFFRRRETAQQCAAQGLAAVETPQEECEAFAFDFTAPDKKCRKKRRKVPEKCQLGERKQEREVKMHGLEKWMEGGSELREAGEKKRKGRKRKEQKITEPKPLLVEVKPLHSTVRSCILKPIEGEPMLPSVSGHLTLAAAHFKPLPPVTKAQRPAPAPEDVISLACSPLQEDPPKLLAVPPRPDEVVSPQRSSSQMLPLAVPPRPTPAPDVLFFFRRSSSKVHPPKRLPLSPTHAPDEVIALQRPPSRKPQPVTSSPLEPLPELILVDMEDEEKE